MRLLFFLLLLTTGLFGCRVLSKSQKDAISNFSEMTKTISQVPNDIYSKYYDLEHEFRNLNDATLLLHDKDLGENIANLEKSLIIDSTDTKKIQQIKLQYGILNKFTTLLLALSNKASEDSFAKRKTEFISSFQSMRKTYNSIFPNDTIPASLGSLVGGIVQEIGNRSIRSLQRKYVIQLLSEAQQPFKSICDYYVTTHSKNIARFADVGKEIATQYKSYLIQLKLDSFTTKNMALYQVTLIPMYQRWRAQAELINELAKNAKTGMKGLENSYDTLLSSLQGKIKIKDWFNNLKPLYESYGNINDAYNAYEKDLDKIKSSKELPKP